VTTAHDTRYAYEKFSEAIGIMATSELPLRQRLLEARTCFVAVDADDMPAEARADFVALDTRMSSVKASRGEGDWAATLAAVSDDEVRRLARLLVDIFWRLEDAVRGGV